ncbi:MAG: alpha/beta fold hydrolase [Proteobacteria bacterium]|nr:alpha/beta fold hydrolase [Pseudomonadota bacterium]MDA1062870.1 alpha/beta fold hydrolase [Pseudomonadota bacterium]
MQIRYITGSTAAAALLLVSLEACVTAPRTAFAQAPGAADCVVLIHGLNRSWRAMQPMAEALREAGFSTVNVDYPSQAGSIEILAPMAVDTGLADCREAGADRIHFVTHSIGGILLRYAHQASPIPELGRVVMLAPPNQGSEVIDITRNWPTTEIFAGEAGLQLGTDPDSIPRQLGPIDFELGVIAGTGSVNFFMSAMLPEPNDGKVSVASTRIDGMTDFLIVDNSHHFITESDVVIHNTSYFLKHGIFAESTMRASSQ